MTTTKLDADMTAHAAARAMKKRGGPVCVFASILPGQHEWIRAHKRDVLETLQLMGPAARVHLKLVESGVPPQPWFFLSQRFEDDDELAAAGDVDGVDP